MRKWIGVGVFCAAIVLTAGAVIGAPNWPFSGLSYIKAGTQTPISGTEPLPVRMADSTGTDLSGDTTAIKTAVQIMDDWDESDRAKVNPIVGQAGVAAGAGAVGVTVQRMTLASDDPAVASMSVLDDWDESNRAAVNLIASQAGITGGAGAVAANTPRFTLGSDDPAVAALKPQPSMKAKVISTSTNTAAISYQLTTPRTVCFENVDASINVCVSDDNSFSCDKSTADHGVLVEAGEEKCFETNDSLWTVAASGTPKVIQTELGE